jgi:hypothetical protein
VNDLRLKKKPISIWAMTFDREKSSFQSGQRPSTEEKARFNLGNDLRPKKKPVSIWAVTFDRRKSSFQSGQRPSTEEKARFNLGNDLRPKAKLVPILETTFCQRRTRLPKLEMAVQTGFCHSWNRIHGEDF